MAYLRSSTAGDVVPSEPLTHRNLVINGGMQVWQRATAATTAAAFATVDRWKFDENTDGAYTSEKVTLSLADLATTGHATAVKLDCTTADTSIASSQYAYINQQIEAQNLQHLQYGGANAKTITLSFWVKSNKTGTYCISLIKVDTTAYNYVREYTIIAADTWEYKTITITPTAPNGTTALITGSGGIIVNDNGRGFELGFALTFGSTYNGGTSDTWTAGASHYSTSSQVNWMDSTSNNFYLTGVQLELGSAATPFEHRSYGDELARCMRYYEESKTDVNTMWAFAISTSDTGYRRANIHFKVTKRATPTVTSTGDSPTGNQNVGPFSFSVYWDGAGAGDYKACSTWTAAAEL